MHDLPLRHAMSSGPLWLVELAFGADLTPGRRPALRGAARRSRRRGADAQSGGTHLEEHRSCISHAHDLERTPG
jgi:hypothetical protein